MSSISSASRTSSSDLTTGMTSLGSSLDDPTCIVGMACRVPGAESPARLWDNIVRQVDLRRKMPPSRFNVDAFYHPDGTHKGTTNARYGYFLDQDIGLFDASFFHISGREAEAMDPQQRLLLEVVYEALENAGITLEQIKGTQTSVFCGTFTSDYETAGAKDSAYYPKYTVTGTGRAILSNRISYFYDLHGPSVTIDTACSSSLVGFHLGNQTLKSGDADLSIIVGSALHFDPRIFIEMTDLGMLSSDGRCRHGDAQASGYVRGEGITAVILKTKSRAEQDGDRIRAIVRGTGVNHDGAKQGITMPSDIAQADLITRVYAQAHIDPCDTQYVECHGTGTKAGDPRELRALGNVFSTNREEPLWIGSVKTNIGHLEGASGLAGIIKATMALEHRQIPPNMHFETPNPEIDFENWKLRIPTKTVDWDSQTVRRASINSFGYGGTNAHVILEEYVPVTSYPWERSTSTSALNLGSQIPFILLFTAHTERAGKKQVAKLRDYLATLDEALLRTFAYSLSHRRQMHDVRSFAIGCSKQQLLAAMETPSPTNNRWASKMADKPRLGFVFTGQGAQWCAMGRQLIECCLPFRQSLERCDRVLAQLPEKPLWSVIDELLQDEDTTRLDETEISQPLCTALQLALVDLLTYWDITPKAVIGHSSGEIAACYAAGLLSFENAIVAAFYRGLHMGSGSTAATGSRGAMMAVGLSEAETRNALLKYEGRLLIAAMNSPQSFTVSGDEDAIHELYAELVAEKVFARRLQVAQAFHSHHMLPLAPAYECALRQYPGFVGQTPSVRMISSVTARLVDSDTMIPSYFTANMTGTVRFFEALASMVLDEDANQTIDVLVEIGPHPALRGPSKQTLDSLNLQIPYLGSLDRSKPAVESLLSLAGQLFTFGCAVELSKLNQSTTGEDALTKTTQGRTVALNDLPTYAWDHERYWAETRVVKEYRLRKSNHEVLGAQVAGSLDTRPRYRNYLRTTEIPWLLDHMIDGQVVFPAAGYLNMAIEAISRLPGNVDPVQFHLKDVSIRSALIVNRKDSGTEIMLELQPKSDSTRSVSECWYDFVIFSFDDTGKSQQHCTGLIRVEQHLLHSVRNTESQGSWQDYQRRTDRSIPVNKYYTRLAGVGLQYGPTFQQLNGLVESGPGFATASIRWSPEMFSKEDNAKSIVHPSFLDASLHPLFAAVEAELGKPFSQPYVPTFIHSLRISNQLTKKELHTGFDGHVLAEAQVESARIVVGNVQVGHTATDTLLINMQGLELTSLGLDAGEDLSRRSLFFGIKWKPMLQCLDGFASKVQSQSLSMFIDIYAHQYPNRRMLGLGVDREMATEILRTLGGVSGQRRRFNSVTFWSNAPHEIAFFQTLECDYDSRVSVRSPDNEKFDIIVVGPSYSKGLDIASYLSHKGCILTPSNSGEEYVDMHNACNFGNFSLWSSLVQKEQMSSLTLIMPNMEDAPLATKIADEIEQRYPTPVHRVKINCLSMESVVAGDFIVLASLDEAQFLISSESIEGQYEGAKTLLTSTTANIVWLTQGALMDAPRPQQAIVQGLVRSARSENEELRVIHFDVSLTFDAHVAACWAIRFLDRVISDDEICERDGILYTSRIEANDTLNAKISNGVNSGPIRQSLIQHERPLALYIPHSSSFNSLDFSDDLTIIKNALLDNEIEIEVKASVISSRDVAASMGTGNSDRLGDACAGVVRRIGTSVLPRDFQIGDCVVAWRPGQGAHRTVCRNPARLCYKISNDRSFAGACAMTLPLTTAYYSIVETARIQAGETILISAGADSVGWMAIQIAKLFDARILALITDDAERQPLMKHFGLAEVNIISLQDTKLTEQIMDLTHGCGVDIIFRCSKGPLLHDLSTVLAPFGRFVDTGTADIHRNTKLDMASFKDNVTFTSVNLINMFEKNGGLAARLLKKCVRLIGDGTIRPPPNLVTIPYSEASKGFFLAKEGNIASSVVLMPQSEDMVMVLPPKAFQEAIFSDEKMYLLIGGLGGLGRSLSEWMYRKGARQLAFLSRSGDQYQDAKDTIQWLRHRGVKVCVYRADVCDAMAVTECIDHIGDRLAGIFQAAMVLQDSSLASMTRNQWQTCLRPKVEGTYNLHKATLKMDLDFFVCFSSISGAIGTKGQANYSAANTYMDALCRYRRSLGLPGTTMNVGMITGIGAVAENDALRKIMERIGYDGVNENELFAQVEHAVTCSQTDINNIGEFEAHQTITGVNLSRDDYYWCNKPLVSNLYSNHDFLTVGSPLEASQDILTLLRTTACAKDRQAILAEAFIEKIASLLAIERARIEPERNLSEYGLDSISAVEIRKWFSNQFGVELAILDVLGSKSISSLMEKVDFLLIEIKENTTADSDKSQLG